jgi:hypothetical protein
MHNSFLLPLALGLFKPIAHVCTQKMAEDGLGASQGLGRGKVSTKPIFSHLLGTDMSFRILLSQVINLLSLPSPCFFIWHIGQWLDLACGIPEVWALGPKL